MRFIEKKTIFIIIFCVLSMFLVAKDELPDIPPNIRAPIDTLFDAPLSRGLDLVYQDRYQEALVVFDSLQKEFPDHPALYFYKAAVYQSWMSSFRFNHFHKELEENVVIAIEKGNDLMKIRKNDPWLNFYIGAAYGYRAFFRYRRNNWIGAYLDGKKGVGNFKKALKKDLKSNKISNQKIWIGIVVGVAGSLISILASGSVGAVAIIVGVVFIVWGLIEQGSL